MKRSVPFLLLALSACADPRLTRPDEVTEARAGQVVQLVLSRPRGTMSPDVTFDRGEPRIEGDAVTFLRKEEQYDLDLFVFRAMKPGDAQIRFRRTYHSGRVEEEGPYVIRVR